MCPLGMFLPFADFGTRIDAFEGPFSAELANRPTRMAEPRIPGGAVSSMGIS